MQRLKREIGRLKETLAHRERTCALLHSRLYSTRELVRALGGATKIRDESHVAADLESAIASRDVEINRLRHAIDAAKGLAKASRRLREPWIDGVEAYDLAMHHFERATA